MPLDEVAVSEFQSYFEEQRVKIDPEVTLLAGRNNVGKSAFLRALRVFSEPQLGARPNFRITLQWTLTLEQLQSVFPVPDPTNDPFRRWFQIAEEHILVASFVPNGGLEPLDPGHLFCDRLELPRLAASATGKPGTNIGWQSGEFSNSATGVGQLVNLAQRLARQVRYIAPRRIDQGKRSLYPQEHLTPDGRNLAEVLLDLQLNRPTSTFAALIAFMQTAFPEIETLTLRTDPGHASQTVGEPHVLYRGKPDSVPISLCGSGVEQMLALAISLLTSPENQLFLVDEPQAYLHPHAERSLLALLGERRQHQYVIATHSGLLLNSRPLSHARLLTIVNGATRVLDPSTRGDILDELGLTASDLWLRDRVLWVEGPSEEAVIRLLLEEEGSDELRAGLAVKRMPDAASRFSGKSAKQAEASYRFCQDVTAAVSPLPVVMRFLFDSDEKGEEHKRRISDASGGRAAFLPARELENLFLDPGIVTEAVSRQCTLLGLDRPASSDVGAFLTETLGRTEDRRLYPRGLTEAQDPTLVVRGSEVLNDVFWHFTSSEYDKVKDGRLLAEIALAEKPDVLDPLRTLLAELA